MKVWTIRIKAPPQRRQFPFGRRDHFAHLVQTREILVQPLVSGYISWASSAKPAREYLLRLAANPYPLG